MALLGGSFNPPHIGHLRMALEVIEHFHPLLKRVLLVPSARPPHKSAAGLLPFFLRCDLLEETVAQLEGLEVSRLEGERFAPSYTWDTIIAFRNTCPGTDFYFVLGSDDYLQLPTWYKGLDLPKISNFIVVPRGAFDLKLFCKATEEMWPKAKLCQDFTSFFSKSLWGEWAKDCAYLLPGGGLSFFFPLTWLEVSATELRQRWLSGKSLDFLVPELVLRGLRREQAKVNLAWGSHE
ncbi:MAG: nicotinate (nicotinamide) nucleotide adenylyltransferase [Desulfovibrio sp.]|nr:nicotinate (nicotinamide) nucleotide adenylyltransferase [Desulfovibrio sp.]